MRRLPNLAARPFVNRAPVRRAALALWLLAVAVLAVDAYRYWNHFMGLGRRQEQLAEVTGAIARERAAIEGHRARIESLDIDWLNRQTEFLNDRIEARAFSWSRLFDRLAEVLPRDVRLERLSPSIPRSEPGRSTRSPVERGTSQARVALAMNGSARTQEALYSFVDAMFEHPAFGRPVLARETIKDEVAFNLTVTYLPDVEIGDEAAAEAAAAPTEEAPSSAPVAGGGA